MNIKLTSVLVLLLIVLSCSHVETDWIPGNLHFHSDFSDGNRTPEKNLDIIAKMGSVFCIPTDHDKGINPTSKITKTIRKDYGYDNYINRYTNSNIISQAGVPLIVIPGLESSRTPGHTLSIGEIHQDDQLINTKTQQEVINRINALGWLPIAAHPFSKKFPYNTNQAEGIFGIEFFNDDVGDGYIKTRDWYLALLKKGKKVKAFGCGDNHYVFDPKDADKWKKRTWVKADHLDKPSILEAIRQGKTIAAYAIVGIKQPDEKSFEITFEKETKIKGMRIYRDNEEVYYQPYDKALKDVTLSLDSNLVLPGDHQYIFEIEDYFITSPISINTAGFSNVNKILYIMEDSNGRTGLYIINPDGSGLRKWQNWQKDWQYPNFSSNGQRIIFQQPVGQVGGEICSFDLKTQQVTRLYPKSRNEILCANHPCLSPDGQKIVFERILWAKQSDNSLSGRSNEIWTMNSDGQDAKLLDKQLDGQFMGDFSPDGSSVTFSSGNGLSIYDLKKRKRTNMPGVPIGPADTKPCWLPNSNMVAYLGDDVVEASGQGTWYDLYLVDIKNGQRKTLASDLRFISDLDWSPDGRQLVLLLHNQYSDPRQGAKIMVINPENPSQRKTIFETSFKIHGVFWSKFKVN